MNIGLTILGGVCTAIITSIIFGLAGRLRVHTRNDEDIKEIKKEVEDLNKGQKIIFKLLLPLLIKAQGKENNGEMKEALKLYNEYMQEK